jgi:uncharacterized membrane protein
LSEGRLRIAVGLLAALGAAIAGYLVLARYTHASLYCPTSGCETVQSSRYAELLGAPVSVLGLVAFLTVFASALGRSRVAVELGAAVALSALAFAAYLLAVQLVAIQAICAWCVASDAVLALLAAASALRLGAASRRVGPRG